MYSGADWLSSYVIQKVEKSQLQCNRRLDCCVHFAMPGMLWEGSGAVLKRIHVTARKHLRTPFRTRDDPPRRRAETTATNSKSAFMQMTKY